MEGGYKNVKHTKINNGSDNADNTEFHELFNKLFHKKPFNSQRLPNSCKNA